MQVPSNADVRAAPQQTVSSTVVKVPEMDDAAEFFASTSLRENIELTSEDFDDIFMQSANL